MDQEGQWRLSPAYDICHSFRPGSDWVDKHNLTINGKREGFTKEDFLAVAKNMNIKKAPHIINQISEVIKQWAVYADEQKVTPALRDAIKQTLLPL